MLAALALVVAAHAKPELSVGYHGDMLAHPGVVARASVAFASARSVVGSVEGQAMGYWHPGLMTAAQLRVGPAIRVTGPRGGTWGAFAHAGAEHGWWTSPTWEVTDGVVRRVKFAGDGWGIVAAGVELGHVVTSARLAGWVVRPQVGLRYPTFHGVGIDLGVELGLRFGGGR